MRIPQPPRFAQLPWKGASGTALPIEGMFFFKVQLFNSTISSIQTSLDLVVWTNKMILISAEPSRALQNIRAFFIASNDSEHYFIDQVFILVVL